MGVFTSSSSKSGRIHPAALAFFFIVLFAGFTYHCVCAENVTVQFYLLPYVVVLLCRGSDMHICHIELVRMG